MAGFVWQEITLHKPPVQIDPEMDAVLRRELIAGERIIWSGQPNPNLMYSAFGIWLFAIPWTAFALFWEAMALIMLWGGGTKTPEAITYTFGIIFPLFGIPFVAVGCAMLWRPFATIRQAGRTVFALTNQRMLRVSIGKERDTQSVMLDQMGPIDVKAGSDGYGTLRIQTGSSVDSDGDRVTERFFVTSVPDVSRLEGLLLEQRAALSKSLVP